MLAKLQALSLILLWKTWPTSNWYLNWEETDKCSSPSCKGEPGWLSALWGAARVPRHQVGDPKGPCSLQDRPNDAAKWAGRPGLEGGSAGRTAGISDRGGNRGGGRRGSLPARPARPGQLSPLTPSRHTLSSRSAMARDPGARARRRPKLRKERPGPAGASPGDAAGRPSPGVWARRDDGRLPAGPRPGPSAASRAEPASVAGTPPGPPGRRRGRHLGTPAGSPDLPAHPGSHLRREGGAERRGRPGGGACEPSPAHSKMAGEWGRALGAPGAPAPSSRERPAGCAAAPSSSLCVCLLVLRDAPALSGLAG